MTTDEPNTQISENKLLDTHDYKSYTFICKLNTQKKKMYMSTVFTLCK